LEPASAYGVAILDGQVADPGRLVADGLVMGSGHFCDAIQKLGAGNLVVVVAGFRQWQELHGWFP